VNDATARPTLEPLLTAPQVAELLSASESLVYALRRAGKLRAVRVGTLLRFRPADVRAYIDGT
jgi:excisionase family DNA binding protein